MNPNPILTQAINLRGFDRIRITQNDDQFLITVFKCQNLVQSIFRFLYDLYEYIFCGGRKKLDNETFDHLWNEIKFDMENLKHYLDNSKAAASSTEVIHLDESRFEFLQELLQLEGVIKATEWEESLIKADSSNYKKFTSEISELQNKAKQILSKNPDLLLNAELKRWVNSNSQQRTFRVMTESGQLPYLYNEIPKGYILLTNLDAYKAFLFSRGFSLTLSQRLRQLKKYANLIFTGSRYIHAEISLGNGIVYHQDKKDNTDGFSGGKGYIEDRENKLCFHDIRKPKQPIKDEDWDKIKEIIGDQKQGQHGVEKIRTTLSSMLRTVIHKKRGKDYKPPSFDPKVPNKCSAFGPDQANACSAVVAIFHSILGIDVGTQFNKRVEDISPADLANSNQYSSFYHSGL